MIRDVVSRNISIIEQNIEKLVCELKNFDLLQAPVTQELKEIKFPEVL
jgi:hypothetical protein